MYKVLLVDDEPFITKGLQAILDWEDLGFEVVKIAGNGAEALSYIKENTVHLLITDIMMPKMTGLELIEEAKRIQPFMKCMILSGYQEFNFVKQGVKLGIENYLLKPVDEDELLKSIQTISQKLYRSFSSNQYPGFTTLKDNTLWRLVNGEIEKGEWQERLSLYNMNFLRSFYNVSILHFEYEKDLELNKRMQTYIEDNYPATCFYNPDQELIIIFEADNKGDLLIYNNELLNQYLAEISDEVGRHYLSMGIEVTSVGGLIESYVVARELTLNKAVLEDGVLITESLPIDKQKLLEVEQESKVQLAKSIMDSREEVEKSVQLFFRNLQLEKNFVSHRVVRKYAMDLISFVHHSVRKEKYSNQTSSIEKLFHATNIQEIQNILEDYCDDLIDKMNQKDETRSPVIQKILKYMHENYDQSLSLKTLSQRFYVNPIYLGQLFQKEVGMVFSDYINHYRLEKSKELLRDTQLRAGHIGKKVGYGDITYFYKQFKRNVGATPTEWRNM